MTTVKAVSPTSEVSMRFLKSGRSYEALLWGKADCVPIGVYHRGPSMTQVLDVVYRNVKKQCLKVWKLNGAQPYTQENLALAG